MSSHGTGSEDVEVHESFGDPELTPKPLQIAKQKMLRPSEPVTIKQLPSLSNARSQQNLPLIRASSVSSNRTQLDLSQQDPAAPTSRWARRNAFLHVNKQRRSDPGCTTMATHSHRPDNTTDFYSSSSLQRPSNCREINVGAPLGSHADARRAGAEALHAGTRAVTIGALKRTDSQNSINDEQWVLLAPTPLVRRRRRAVTTDAGFNRIIEPANGNLDDDSMKQPSTKHRLISRVMSGLTNKAHTSHAPSRGDNQTIQQQEHPHHITIANQQDIRCTNRVRRSSSSTRTNNQGGSQLEDALSAFPTPPTTAGTSPTTGGLGACPRPLPQRYRNLRKPEGAATLGAQLTLTPEYDHLIPENGKTLFVAIDVEGVFNTTISGQNLWSQHTGLDVVVIIDNSLCTSPNTLMASCETTRFLASILNIATDRLAILCTSVFNANDSKSMTVWPLTPIKMNKLKSALDRITCSVETLKRESWASVIDRAKDLLLHSQVLDRDTEVLQDTFGLVVILSASTTGLAPELLAYDGLNYHIICPTIFPRRGAHVTSSTSSEGWRFRSLSASEQRAVFAGKDPDPTSLFNRVRGLVTHARGGSLPGRLHDVALDIMPGPECSIEGVMGESEWPQLHPGELHTVLVKLRVRTLKARGYSLCEATQESGVPLDSDDVLGELDEMLGVSPVKILTAKLRYRHPLLPQDTMCSVTVNCQLKRQLLISDQGKGVAKSEAALPLASKTLVQQRLAFHLATNGSPRNALSKVRKEFGETGLRSFCPEYVNLIINELKFQARITERLYFNASPEKPIISEPLPKQPDNPSGYLGQYRLQAANYKPDDWITEAIDEGVSNCEEVQLAVLSNGKLLKRRPSKWLYSEPNEVKLIWEDLLRVSKHQEKHSLREPSKPSYMTGLDYARRAASSGAEQDRQRRVRELDVWVKESVRMNTLRDRGSFVDSKAKQAGATRL